MVLIWIIDVMAYMQQYNKETPSLPWYKCWNIDNKEFYDAMKKIEQDFGYLFPTELFNVLDRLLDRIAPINNRSVTPILGSTTKRQEDVTDTN